MATAYFVYLAGRTGRAGTRGRATSFFTDRDAFLVSQIKTALAELEKGNAAAFAMGKEARQAEKALAQKFKSNMKLSSEGLVASGTGLAPAVKVCVYGHSCCRRELWSCRCCMGEWMKLLLNG